MFGGVRMRDIKRPCFTQGELESVCKILANTHDGLTGTEIGYYLKSINIKDIDPTNTKWKRLFNALIERQNSDNAGNKVLGFISQALQPAKYAGNLEIYRDKLEKINVILAFHGLEFREDGQFHITNKVKILSEAEKRASRLKDNLLNRNVHSDLLKFCRAELLQENYFHAVLEATKSIAWKIREKTGLNSDGAKLIDEAFSGKSPLLKINNLRTETDISEQKGFVNLAKGLFGTFRNPTAHAPKIEWNMAEEDALDLFTLASYVLRRIEQCKQGVY